MKNNWKMTLAALAVIGAATTGSVMQVGAKTEKAAEQKAAIAWQPSLTAAKAEAKRSGKPVLAVFHAKWCGACKMLENQTLTDAKVIGEVQKWVPVRIDVDEEKNIAASYRIESLPTMIFIKSSGERGLRFEGALEADDMVKLLKDAHDKVQK